MLPMLVACAAGTSHAQDATVLNNQIQLGDIFSSQTLNVVEVEDGVGAETTATGNSVLAGAQGVDMAMTSNQTMAASAQAVTTANVSAGLGEASQINTSATGNSADASVTQSTMTGVLSQIATFSPEVTARGYVEAETASAGDLGVATTAMSNTASLGLTNGAAGVAISTASGTEAFDHVVLACHSDQAMALLADLDPQERDILQAIPYQPNQAWLHTDAALMPRRRSAWAAWNYLSDGNPQAPKVSVTYWLNRLQPLPFRQPVLLSLNPLQAPADERVIARFDYEHPIFDQAAVAAQRRLRNIQGRRNTWFAGAWTAYGFHEDGLRSGLAVADDIVRLGSRARAAA